MTDPVFSNDDLSNLLGVDIPKNCEIELSITSDELSVEELSSVTGGKSFTRPKGISGVKIGFKNGASRFVQIRKLNTKKYEILCW